MAFDFFEFLIYAFCLGLPAFSFLWFAVSLYRFCIAKHRIKHGTRQYDAAAMKRRKLHLIISSVLFGVIALILLSFVGLLMMAVAFM